MALADTANLAVKLTLDDRQFTGALKRTQTGIARLGTQLGRVGKGIGQVGAGFYRVGVVAAAAAAGGLIAATKAGAEFEAQLNTINTIARESPDGLQAIGDGLRTLAREGRGSLADLSAGYYDILSAGIGAANAQSVLSAATTLAIGGLSTNAQAVDLLTTAINAYGQEASQAQADADLFAKAIELGKVTADEIAASFANVAPIAAQQRIEIEEVAAAYAALTAQGVPAAEVTTQMSRAIVELLDPNKELLALQKKLGVSFLDIAQNEGLVVALQAMRDAVGGDEQAFKALFGRIEGYKFALQTTGPQQQIYNDALAAMGDAAGTAAAQMGERTQGLAFQVNKLKANLIDAGLTLAEGFLPQLAKSVSKLTEFLQQAGNQQALRALGQDIGRAIESIDWGRVLDGAKTFIGLTKTLLGVLARIPIEIHAAVLAFGALNRLSGGLIGTGVGNIVGGLAGAAGVGIASRAPGIGKLFAQPVFVTNWPLGGLGGVGAGAAGGAGGFGLLGGGLLLAGLGAAMVSIAGPIGEAVRKAVTGSTAPLTRDYVVAEAGPIQIGLFRSQIQAIREGNAVQQRQLPAITTSERTLNALAVQSRLSYARDTHETAVIASRLTSAKTAIVSAGHGDKSAIVGAIRANRPIVNVAVRVNQGDTIRVTRNYRSGSNIGQPGGPRTGGQQEF